MLKISLLLIPLIFFAQSCSAPPTVHLEPILDSEVINHGKTLVKGLAACGFCHGENSDPLALLTGGRDVFDKYGPIKSPNLTTSKSGIRDWDLNQITRAIRASRGKNDEYLSREVHKGFEWLSDYDARAIASYLKTLPPIEHEVERRGVSFIDRNTTGFFDKWHEVKGYVPRTIPRFVVEYGKYMVDHVARCGSCHNSPGDLLSGEGYLLGGQVINRDGEGKEAPGITYSTENGIGSWSEENIVHYLQSGRTPEQRGIDPNFCPVNFYINAPREDLVAIARYLTTVGE